MNRNILKKMTLSMTSTMVILGSVWVSNVTAATVETEVPLAGITIPLNEYYDETVLIEDTTEPVTESAELDEELIQEQINAVEANDTSNSTEETEEATKSEASEYDNIGIANVSNYLNIRDKANEDGKIIGKLVKNAGCKIISIEDGWARIKSGKVNGYVNADYLITGKEAEELAKVVGSKTAVVINTSSLRVRLEPSMDAKTLTLIPRAEELEVLEELDGWVKVEVDRDEGFVSKEYVEISYELKKAVAVTEISENSSTGVSSVRANMVSYAKQFLGNRYVWGGTSLTNGTDCSGFTMSIYKHFGYSISRTSRSQASCGTVIKTSQARPGDLIFYGNGGSINHVAMCIGNGQVIHASNARTGIKISNLYYRTPIKAVRIIND